MEQVQKIFLVSLEKRDALKLIFFFQNKRLSISDFVKKKLFRDKNCK